MYGYIYLTHDSLNNKFYIGQHKFVNIKFIKPNNRFDKYYLDMYEKSHGFRLFYIDPKYIGSGTYLKRAIKKYGKENFYIADILGIADSKWELDDLEQFFIRDYRQRNYDLYNIAKGGRGGLNKLLYGKANGMYGKHLSEEHKEKISKALKGRKYSKREYEIHKNSRKPWKHSEEIKRHLSKVAKGRTSPTKGKSMSLEQKQKISESLKNYFKTSKGIKQRQEHSLKISKNQERSV